MASSLRYQIEELRSTLPPEASDTIRRFAQSLENEYTELAEGVVRENQKLQTQAQETQKFREAVADDVSRILSGSHALWRSLKRFPTVRHEYKTKGVVSVTDERLAAIVEFFEDRSRRASQQHQKELAQMQQKLQKQEMEIAKLQGSTDDRLRALVKEMESRDALALREENGRLLADIKALQTQLIEANAARQAERETLSALISSPVGPATPATPAIYGQTDNVSMLSSGGGGGRYHSAGASAMGVQPMNVSLPVNVSVAGSPLAVSSPVPVMTSGAATAAKEPDLRAVDESSKFRELTERHLQRTSELEETIRTLRARIANMTLFSLEDHRSVVVQTSRDSFALREAIAQLEAANRKLETRLEATQALPHGLTQGDAIAQLKGELLTAKAAVERYKQGATQAEQRAEDDRRVAAHMLFENEKLQKTVVELRETLKSKSASFGGVAVSSPATEAARAATARIAPELAAPSAAASVYMMTQSAAGLEMMQPSLLPSNSGAGTAAITAAAVAPDAASVSVSAGGITSSRGERPSAVTTALTSGPMYSSPAPSSPAAAGVRSLSSRGSPGAAAAISSHISSPAAAARPPVITPRGSVRSPKTHSASGETTPRSSFSARPAPQQPQPQQDDVRFEIIDGRVVVIRGGKAEPITDYARR